MAPRPAGPGGFGSRPGAGPGRFAPRTPRPPPTEEQVNALAVREHVPYRIARGELEGKMKARVWRKLHAEEAKRFDQVYEIMGKNPGVDLADAFGILQSGLTPDEFKARKERTQKKVAVRQARTSVDAAAVEQFIGSLVTDKAELSVVLGERGFLDTIVQVEPIAFRFERSGRLEKLQVVVLARRAVWERLQPNIERDPKLAQKPAPAIRQPERRPVSDPRPFTDHVGQVLDLTLRNGIRLALPLRAVGPFDLLLGENEPELFVPLHAVLSWQAQAPAES